MSYTVDDANSDIAKLQALWSGDMSDYVGAVIAMKNLIDYGNTNDPTSGIDAAAVKLQFSAQDVWIDALVKEPQYAANIEQLRLGHGGPYPVVGLAALDLDDRFKGPPRYYMLKGIADATQASWFSDGDPAGVTGWINFIDPAGDAIAKAIGSDPDPLVRYMALVLLKGSAWPIEWARSVLTGLGGLDDQLAASTWDVRTRSSLTSLSRDVRATALRNQNVALTIPTVGSSCPAGTTPTQTLGGQVACQPAVPGKPWYKRIELWGAAIGGAFAGVKLFEKSRRA